MDKESYVKGKHAVVSILASMYAAIMPWNLFSSPRFQLRKERKKEIVALMRISA
jgi:hypothetical protein